MIVSLVKIIAIVVAIIIALIGITLVGFLHHHLIGYGLLAVAVILLIYGFVSNRKTKAA
jgi:hypothetical protein